MRPRVTLTALLLTGSARAQEASGFVEIRGTGYTGVDGVPVQLVERARPELEAKLGERVLLDVTVEAAFAQGRDTQHEVQRTLEESDLGPALEAAGCTWPTDDNEVLGVSSASDYLSVERLYLDFYSKGVDVRVGRQALNWGSARFFNPTDPFPEVLLTEPWRPRRGVNAVRATVPIGEAHQVQAVLATNDTFTEPRAALRGTVNALGTDFSLIGAYRGDSDEGLAGVDIRGTLGVGFWLEGAVRMRPRPRGGVRAWEEVAVGVDYSFPVLETLVLAAQYYRNGRTTSSTGAGGLASAIEPPECDGITFPEPAEPDPFASTLAGHDYLLLTASLGLTPDVSVSVAGMQNLGDGTGFAFPSVSVAATGAISVSAAAQVPYRMWGDGGEFMPADEDLVVEGFVPGQQIDISGLVPSATFILWTRASF